LPAANPDYVSRGSVVSFAPGSLSRTVSVTVNGDSFPEGDEVFHLDLTGADHAVIADGHGAGIITNDDGVAQTLSIGDVSLLEGDSGATDAVFVLSLSAPALQDVRVHCATSDGTALQDSDYQNTSGDFVIPMSGTSTEVRVSVFGDHLLEPAETFSVQLSLPSNAVISRAWVRRRSRTTTVRHCPTWPRSSRPACHRAARTSLSSCSAPNFAPGATAFWNGLELPTAYASPARLNAVVPGFFWRAR